MSLPRSLRLLFCLGLIGCAGDSSASEANLRVDLRTDLLPGTEFDGVSVFVGFGDSAESTSHVALSSSDYVRGVRLGDFDVVLGEVSLRVVVYQDGEPVIERPVTVNVQNSSVVTVVITRDCRGVMCPAPAGNSRAIACLGGECEDPRCTPATPEFCINEGCTSDSECDDGCLVGTCLTGACITRPDDGACNTGERCDPDVGCIEGERPDAGMADAGPADASFDAGPVNDAGPMVDGGFDAGVMCAVLPTPAGACDPLRHTGCPDGQKCQIVLNSGYESMCIREGTSVLNDSCASGDCAPGLFCLRFGSGSGVSHCRALCAADCGCADPMAHCVAGPDSYGYCADSECDPVANTGCPTDQFCVISGNRTLCVDAVGTTDIGGACPMASGCRVGTLCVNGDPHTCQEACRVTDGLCDCGSVTSDGVYGYCRRGV